MLQANIQNTWTHFSNIYFQFSNFFFHFSTPSLQHTPVLTIAETPKKSQRHGFIDRTLLFNFMK